MKRKDNFSAHKREKYVKHQYDQAKQRDDRFLLQQLRRGAAIRVQDGRASATDILAVNLDVLESSQETERVYIDRLLDGTDYALGTISEALQMGLDSHAIGQYAELEVGELGRQYWQTVLNVVATGEVHVLNGDIESLVGDKSGDELKDLETEALAMEPSSFRAALLKSVRYKLATKQIDDWEAQVRRTLDSWCKTARTLSSKTANDLLDPSYKPFCRPRPEKENKDKVKDKKEASEPSLQELYMPEVGVTADLQIVPLESIAEESGLKPKFFSSVMLNYSWNSYNRAHYSKANPPPKAVNGYKFNIHYPDLASTDSIPTYKIVRQPDQPGTSVLVFHGPPPYRPLGFRIVNRTWDISAHPNAGFVSKFEHGVLSLHFKFKRAVHRD